MSDSQPARPAAETPDGNPEHDPEIEALLDFEPVPRQRDVEGGWTPELQREFTTRRAARGSATMACDEMGKNQTGIMKLYRQASVPPGTGRSNWPSVARQSE